MLASVQVPLAASMRVMVLAPLVPLTVVVLPLSVWLAESVMSVAEALPP